MSEWDDWEEIGTKPVKPVQGEVYLRRKTWKKWGKFRNTPPLRLVLANRHIYVVETRYGLMEYPRKDLEPSPPPGEEE